MITTVSSQCTDHHSVVNFPQNQAETSWQSIPTPQTMTWSDSEHKDMVSSMMDLVFVN